MCDSGETFDSGADVLYSGAMRVVVGTGLVVLGGSACDSGLRRVIVGGSACCSVGLCVW